MNGHNFYFSFIYLLHRLILLLSMLNVAVMLLTELAVYVQMMNSTVFIDSPLSFEDLESKRVDKLTCMLTATSPKLIATIVYRLFKPSDVDRLLLSLSTTPITTAITTFDRRNIIVRTQDNKWSTLTSSTLASIFEYVDDKTRLLAIEHTCKNWRQQCRKSGWTSLNIESIPHCKDTMWCHVMGAQRLKTVRNLQVPMIPREAFVKIVRHTPSVQSARMTVSSHTGGASLMLSPVLGSCAQWTHLQSLDITVHIVRGESNITFPVSLPLLETLRVMIHADIGDGNGDDNDATGDDDIDTDKIVKLRLSTLPKLSRLEIVSSATEVTLHVDENWDPHRTLRHVHLPTHRIDVADFDPAQSYFKQLLGRSSKYLLSLTADIIKDVDDLETVSKMTNLRSLCLNTFFDPTDPMHWSKLSTLSKLTSIEVPWTFVNRLGRTAGMSSSRVPVNVDFMTSMTQLTTVGANSSQVDGLRIMLTLADRFANIEQVRIPGDISLSADELRQLMDTNPVDNLVIPNRCVYTRTFVS